MNRKSSMLFDVGSKKAHNNFKSSLFLKFYRCFRFFFKQLKGIDPYISPAGSHDSSRRGNNSLQDTKPTAPEAI